jgi:hypothetical protein
VRFHIIVVCKIERLAHGVNVSVREERQNIHLKARQIGHGSKNLKDTVHGTVREPIAGPDCDNAVHPIVFLGTGLEHRIHPEIVAGGIDPFSPVQSFSITLGGPARWHV